MKKKYSSFCLLLVLLVFIAGHRIIPKPHTTHSETAEVVSSTVFNDNHYLNIVANTDNIENKEEFSRELTRMYLDNAFQSIKFSFDNDNYPEKVIMSVYLSSEDMKKGNLFFQFEFTAQKQ